MDLLNSIADLINPSARGHPMFGRLGLTGAHLTLALAFIRWRRVGYGLRPMFEKQTVGQGAVKPFNVLMTALSATV